MASRSTIQQAVYDELVGVMAARSDTPDATSDAQNHVVLNEPDLEESLPALSVRWLESPMGSRRLDVHVKTIERDNSGYVTDIVYTEQRRLDAEVSCIARDDGTAVGVYEDVRDHVNAYERFRPLSNIHDDIDEVTCRDASPREGANRRMHLLRIEVEYEATLRYSNQTGSAPTAVETVIQEVGEAPTRTDT